MPVYLGTTHSATLKANRGDALEFSLTTGTKLAMQSHNLTDSASDSDYLNILDFSQNVKIHYESPSAAPILDKTLPPPPP